jgi:hypothetical protein
MSIDFPINLFPNAINKGKSLGNMHPVPSLANSEGSRILAAGASHFTLYNRLKSHVLQAQHKVSGYGVG